MRRRPSSLYPFQFQVLECSFLTVEASLHSERRENCLTSVNALTDSHSRISLLCILLRTTIWKISHEIEFKVDGQKFQRYFVNQGESKLPPRSKCGSGLWILSIIQFDAWQTWDQICLERVKVRKRIWNLKGEKIVFLLHWQMHFTT